LYFFFECRSDNATFLLYFFKNGTFSSAQANLNDGNLKSVPTLYFCEETGVGRALKWSR